MKMRAVCHVKKNLYRYVSPKEFLSPEELCKKAENLEYYAEDEGLSLIHI